MAEMTLGFLPLYLQLYRDVVPDLDDEMAEFAHKIQEALEQTGVHVEAAPVSARKDEIQAAVQLFEEKKVDVIVTLHLAYSPSLEAADALAGTSIPLVLLDTTPDYEYSPDHSGLMTNHGIHGVQDLTNLLRRRGKKYQVVAGHWSDPLVFRRIKNVALAVKAAHILTHSRVGTIGGSFVGMGDFVLSEKTMKSLGIQCVDFTGVGDWTPKEEDIEKEAASLKPFIQTKEDEKCLHSSIVSALIVRHFIEENHLTGFTCNILSAHSIGLPTIPFIEASLAMVRGIGYAGEGDVLDAAWLGALLSVFPQTTFTEMYCPDWKNDRVYLSHMGEVNMALLVNPMLRRQKSGFLPEFEPLAFMGALKAGNATLVNLTPGPDDTLSITTAAGLVQPFPEGQGMRISAYFKPNMPLPAFLEAYSFAGGTHHCALCFDVPAEFWKTLASFLGITYSEIC